MQLKFITAAIASLAIGNVIAGPIPEVLDADEALALYARAEQDTQAQQAQQAQSANLDTQAQQAQQGQQADQAKQGQQGKQWVPGGYYDVDFNGLGINARVRGYDYNNVYYGRNGYYGRGGYYNRGYGRRGWNGYYY